jgi:hypothetical protein
MTEERRDKQGRLLGPKKNSEFLAWRRNRDKMIANPRRLKVVETEKRGAKDSSDQPT